MVRRRVSDRALRRWLATGRPRRVEARLASDPSVARRLDQLTELDEAEAAALAGVVAPEEDFETRVLAGVHRLRDGMDTAALLTDLLGLGLHVGRAMLPDADRPGPDDSRGTSR